MNSRAFVDRIVGFAGDKQTLQLDENNALVVRDDSDHCPYVQFMGEEGNEYVYLDAVDLRKVAKVFKKLADILDARVAKA